MSFDLVSATQSLFTANDRTNRLSEKRGKRESWILYSHYLSADNSAASRGSINKTNRAYQTYKERIGGDEAEGKGGKRREKNKTTQLGKRNGYSTDLSDGRRAEK